DYSACVACGDPSPGYFSAQAGGLLCASCASGVPGCEPVDTNLARWLEGLVSMRFSELAIAPIDSHTAAHVLGLAHLWAATHLECRLRALEFLLGR
ncbi:DNA repair protein RecO C-terminal domain-containing protein, partial [Clostridium perfringens]|nr:DNA repair protein RecO C-terminal domain-containing protein [Clostridium perfringens]